MPTAPIYPSIPVPTDDPKALLEAVLALKQTVEMLTGQDSSEKHAAHVFLSRETPEAIHVGDFWLYEGETFSLNMWNGDRWILITDVVPPAVMRRGPDFLLERFIRRRRTT